MSSPVLQIPLFAALAFLVLGAPQVYAFMHRHVGSLLGVEVVTSQGTPTRFGLVLHALVVFLVMSLYLNTYEIYTE